VLRSQPAKARAGWAWGLGSAFPWPNLRGRRQDFPRSWGTLRCICPAHGPRPDRRPWPSRWRRHGPRL